MRRRSLLWAAFWVCGAVVAASLLVPDEMPDEIYLSQDFQSARLAATGDTLLMRSPQYDYQFELPRNQLNAAFALNLDERMKCSLHDMSFDAETGEAGVDLDVFYGRYDKPLGRDARSMLARLGFTPSNVNVVGVEGPELYMVWGKGSVTHSGSGLKGKRYPPGSRPELTGQDISECIGTDGLYVTVKLDAKTTAKNQMISALTSPFRAIREGIQGCLFFIGIMFGWSAG